MNKYVTSATILLLLPFLSYAGGIDEAINNAVQPISDFVFKYIFYPIPIFPGISMPFILAWLIIAAVFFTFYFKFINLRSFKLGYNLIRGKYDEPNAPGEVTHFQALATAISGTVGLGNIAGVATAVSLGGPGATFWMIVAGFIGMSTKFVECTLGVKYRDIDADGTVHGGPMRYLSKGFAERGFAGFGKVLAVFFAVMCIGAAFGGGNMYQVNQSLEQVVTMTGGVNSFFHGKGWLFGAIIAVFVGVTILGGIKSIVKVTSKLVPFMALIYIITSLFIITVNYNNIGHAFSLIFNGAFSLEAGFGGLIGVLIVGFQRAGFSNEAGIGSAAIAHSAVKTNYPVTEGLVALYEPFIDTVVICTMTALVIIITGSLHNEDGMQGIALTSAAFGSSISWFPYVLTFAAVLFAFSTMISWSYYGMRAWTYLFGHGTTTEAVFKSLFLVFIVIGASINLKAVLSFSDAMLFAMALPNIIGLYFLAPVVKRELNKFMIKIKSGEIVKNY
ncbi:Na(+)-linked D-alanine glycine permease [hydrothermal vent metagenome]|uniref:Na(+)-linked D-alanine glycine permease n=1 Tax=hydrothermal vent metagenome TaxID=652676 RepID=A0A3B0VN16_9ZZZZ